MKKRIFIFPVLLSFIIIYFYLMGFFLAENYWWILLVFIYVVSFILRDSVDRRKELEKKLFVKNKKDIRIDFWK